MVQSVLALPEHLDIFENGVAARLDFSFSGPQGARLAKLVSAGRIEIGAIHTYLELFARYFVDLTPKVALVAAQAADAEGNLYTGPNTEDTPAIVEATAFSGGIVIAQVNELVDGKSTTLPRIDIPADWVNFVVKAPRPNFIEPLFTRDPAQISEMQILMAMMAIKGIYAEYGVQRLNHGIGFDTAAIELLLPTYAESLGLKGKIGKHWALNPHPALIPAIEAGWVESVHSFGSELGMEDYIRAPLRRVLHRPRRQPAQQPRVLPGGRPLRLRHVHRLDAADRPRRQQLHRDAGPHRRLRRCAQHGRRCARPAPCQPGLAQGRARGARRTQRRGRHAARAEAGGADGRDLSRAHAAGLRRPARRLDARRSRPAWTLPPIMIYGDDVSHILTEEGIANLLLCRSDAEREQAIRGVAGYTAVGLARDRRAVENLRDRGVIRRPQDLGIDPRQATRNLLAARSMRDLVRASGGLYQPPKRFRNW